jgi:hypothetical protein
MFCASIAVASTTIQIRATDQNNHPLANVQVQVSSQGKVVQSAVTNSSGRAEFAALPDGAYDLAASKPGFQQAMQKGIVVRNSSLELIEIVLSPQLTVKEVVSVAAGAQVSLEQSSSPSSEVARTEMKQLPSRPATVKDALPLVPGVLQSQDGQIQISGMSEHHSTFLVNSANVTDPVTGQFGLTLPVDAVNSLRVLKDPYEAQYGGFTAGVVSLDTRGGGDKWNFEINDPTPEFRIRSAHIVGLKEFTPRIALNGPVFRERLFLAESFTYDIEKHGVRSLPFPDNQTKLQSFNSFTQLDYVVSPQHLLTASLHVAPEQTQYANLDYFNPRPVTPDFDSQHYTGTLLDRLTVGPGLLQSTLSFTKVQAEVDPRGTGSMVLTPTGNRGNYFSRQNRNALRSQELENFALKPFHAAGTHQLQFGTELTGAGAAVSVVDNSVLILGRRNQLLRRVDYSAVREMRMQDFTGAAYVQDHWLVSSRLALDLGARLERETFSDTTHLAPRLGFRLQPFPGHDTVIMGGFGTFQDHLPLNVGLFERWPEEVITTYPSDMMLSWGSQRYRNRLRARHPRVRIVRFDQNDPGFSPSSAAWNLQVDHRVNSWLRLRAGYAENRSESLVLLLPESTPEGSALTLRDEGHSYYRQFEIGARTNWKKAQMNLSYVRSRAVGDLNEFDFFLGSLPVPIVPRNIMGTLPTDVPNRVLASGHVDLPRKFWVNPLIEFRSGFSYRARDVFQNFLAADNRFPGYVSVDARVGRRFQPTKKYGLIVSAAGTNLTNHFNATTVHANTADPAFGAFFANYGRHLRLDFDVDF